ncbi:MAG: phage Gp37/Gp68 family protein [Pseudomonadales bacterium]|uniref:phage Gp37/Gp68 family protein n=1 Tax=Cupriavidus sp. TaxID=1873897 RepID=UPI003D12CDDE
MSENTNIEWTDATFNPWIGCTKVSPACDHCYAEVSTPARSLGVSWGAKEKRHRTSPGNWKLPLRWNAQHEEFFGAHGRRRRVFCASLADVFDNQVDPAWRRDLFDLIELTPNLNWLLLTKRIGNVIRLVSDVRSHDWLAGRDNVWLGATICNQEEADRDIPKLLAVPVHVRFLSMEPLLGPVDLSKVAVPAEHDMLRRPWDYDGYRFNALQDHDDDRFHQAPATLDWVIVGGESGGNARPMHPDWAGVLRDQCAAAGVPFLFKQWGEHAPNNRTMAEVEAAERGYTFVHYSATQPYPIAAMDRVGKKAAGRLLDGEQHDGFPGSAA